MPSCVPTPASNNMVKFADDATLVRLIRNNRENCYRQCGENNDLLLNTTKMN